MNKTLIATSALGLVLAGMAGSVLAAPDWSKVPSRNVTVFHPGTSGLEWILKGTDHGGAKGISKGETCIGCHEDEKKHTIDIASDKILKGEKLEPKPISGHTPTFPVTVQAANDGANLYLRFSWKDAQERCGKNGQGQPCQAGRYAGK